MKKFISILLALVLTVSLLVPVGAQADDIRYYVMPSICAYDTAVLPGGSANIDFFIPRGCPQFDAWNQDLIIEIYKGDALSFMEDDEPELVEMRQYPCSKFTEGLDITITWKADERYPVGDYTLAAYIISSRDYYIYEQMIALTDLHVVKKECPATCVEMAIFNTYYDCEYDSPFPDQILYNSYISVGTFLPEITTSTRTYKLTSNDPKNLEVSTGHGGFSTILAKKVGTYELTADFGHIKKTVRFDAIMEGLRVALTPENTALCVGQTDHLKAEYFKDVNGSTSSVSESKILPVWTSSNPNVATVKDGTVTAVAPGTTTITLKAGAASKSVTYTVKAHEFSEEPTEVAPTATQPGYQEGKCKNCGLENARNILPALFTDTSATAWYAPHVDYVYENSIMNGVTANTFAPNKAVTRAMVATVLYRAAGSPEVEGEMPFTDVPEGTYYTNAVLWAAQKGIVNGYADGTFLPTRDINREQLATILYRYTESLGVAMNEGAELSEFPDEGDTASYASKALCWAVGEGLITGVKANDGITYLRPKNNATRAQFATIISRYMTTDWEILPPEE